MKFFKAAKTDRLVCTLCQHYCKIKEGNTGICGVNKNTGHAIECLVYGYPSALNVDPVEKKPLFHFLPGSKILSLGTVGCNFHCDFCQNWGISQEHRIDTSTYFSPERLVQLALEQGAPSIAYTYNEPTIFYPYARDIALEGQKHGLKNVYVSNGYESKEVIEDMEGIIDGINIDLKAYDEKYYKKNLGGDLNKVLANIEHFAQKKIWMEITTLVVPTQNDSDEELNKIASFLANINPSIPWHISAFHPDYKRLDLPRTSLESLDRAYQIGKSHGLKYIYQGNIAKGIDTHCSACGSVLIERDSFRHSTSHLVGNQCPDCGHTLEGVFDE